MRSLFDDIVRDGEAVLHSLVSEGVAESVQLDFKRKRNPAEGRWEKDDRRVLAKALSAFANSMGGLIVYGVDARPGPDGVDAVVGLEPISGLSAFSSQAHTLVGQLLMPRHENIVVHAVHSAQGDDTGYLAVWVERSDRRPHRSEADDKQYYKRAGASSFPMEHFDIEDAFNRLAPADIDVEWLVGRGGKMFSGGRKTHQVRIVLQLINRSRVSAIMPYLRLLSHGGYIDSYGLDGNGNHGLDRKPWDQNLFAGGADDAVHPGQALPVAALRLDIQVNDLDEWIINDAMEPTFEIEFECGCANARMHSGAFSISTADLKARIGSLS